MVNIDFKEKYKDTNNLHQSPYDSRDYKFKDLVPLGALKIPTNYESPKTPFIFDQGNSSECAACAYTTVRYLQEQEQSEITEPFSPSFQYANRPREENFEGMYLRTICKYGLQGSIPYNQFPGFYSYIKCRRLFNENKNKYLDMAKEFAISSYYICSSREQVQSAIMTTKGVIIGIPIFDSFYNPDEKGCINYNHNRDIKNYGGHAQLLVGWKTDDSNKLWWITQNSWGEDWANHGRGLLPENYPWLDNAYAIVDNNFDKTWEEYKKQYNIEENNN